MAEKENIATGSELHSRHIPRRPLRRWLYHQEPGDGYSAEEIEYHIKTEACAICAAVAEGIDRSDDQIAARHEGQFSRWLETLDPELLKRHQWALEAHSHAVEREWEILERYREEAQQIRDTNDPAERAILVEQLFAGLRSVVTGMLPGELADVPRIVEIHVGIRSMEPGAEKQKRAADFARACSANLKDISDSRVKRSLDDLQKGEDAEYPLDEREFALLPFSMKELHEQPPGSTISIDAAARKYRVRWKEAKTARLQKRVAVAPGARWHR